VNPAVGAALADVLEHVVAVGDVGVAGIFTDLVTLAIYLASDDAFSLNGDGRKCVDIGGRGGNSQRDESGQGDEELHFGGCWRT